MIVVCTLFIHLIADGATIYDIIVQTDATKKHQKPAAVDETGRIAGSLQVIQNLRTDGDSVDLNSALDVEGTATFQDTVTIAGDLTVNGDIADLNSALDVSGTATFADTINVAGVSELDGGITVDSTNFTVNGTTGAIQTASTINAGGKISGTNYNKDSNVWTVGDTACDATTVQGGVDLASAGDVVLVYPGTYEETITIATDVTVRGIDNKSCTITDLTMAANQGAVTFSDGSKLENITVVDSGTTSHANMIIPTNCEVWLTNVISKQGQSGGGGSTVGIYTSGSNTIVHMEGCEVYPLSTTPMGYGIYNNSDTNTYYINNCIFGSVTHRLKYGFLDGSAGEMSNETKITNCRAYVDQVGFDVRSDTNIIDGVYIDLYPSSSNTSAEHGIHLGGLSWVSNFIIKANFSKTTGGAVTVRTGIHVSWNAGTGGADAKSYISNGSIHYNGQAAKVNYGIRSECETNHIYIDNVSVTSDETGYCTDFFSDHWAHFYLSNCRFDPDKLGRGTGPIAESRILYHFAATGTFGDTIFFQSTTYNDTWATIYMEADNDRIVLDTQADTRDTHFNTRYFEVHNPDGTTDYIRIYVDSAGGGVLRSTKTLLFLSGTGYVFGMNSTGRGDVEYFSGVSSPYDPKLKISGYMHGIEAVADAYFMVDGSDSYFHLYRDTGETTPLGFSVDMPMRVGEDGSGTTTISESGHLTQTGVANIVTAGDGTFGDTISVADVSELDGGITVDSTNFIVSGTTGDIQTAGDITVGDTGSFVDDLFADGGIKNVTDALDIEDSMTVGDGGTTNYTAVSATGDITQAGTARLKVMESRTKTLMEPDQIQGVSDAVPLLEFPIERYPSGVTINDIIVNTSAACIDVLNFEEWSNNGTAWSTDGTVEEDMTLSGTRTEDDGIDTAAIAADAWLFVDLEASGDDIAYMTFTITFTPQ